MKTKKMTRKGFTLVELLVVIAIIVALAALATPAILRQRKKMDMTQAISNSKQIYLVLQDFDQDFGNYPDQRTSQASPELAAFTGAVSNNFLGQLIAGGYTNSEEIFFAKGGSASGNQKPDNVINPPQSILAQGECGFAYVLVQAAGGGGGAGQRGLSSSDNGGIPILCAPVLTAAGEPAFKPDPYDSKGVYLRVDGSARSERLNPVNNNIRLPGGLTLFGQGQGSVWGDGPTALTPTVLPPN